MKKLLIYGASYFDLLKLIASINRRQPTWEVIGFIDDTAEKQGKRFLGVPVLGGREKLGEFRGRDDVYVFNNVSGHWSGSRSIAELLDKYHFRVPSLVHPCIDMDFVTLGRGCILPEGCVVGSQTVLGDFVTGRLGSVVSHNVTIEDHVFIGPGVTIGSEVVLEMGCFVGAGATIMLKRRVGRGACIGAGSLVNTNVAPNTTVAGVPAKALLKTQRNGHADHY